ncbi:hypothetical protein [Streptomyces barkulensis]|uniref:hypothetical protein n=1 Tax=Streptomyces barkulensis TaxID=1257026 RepID=UPI000C6D3B21|nr:hypothetical protein [Streptomyces barkulensis]
MTIKPTVTTGVRTNNIYQLKGDEADAVLLLLPDPGSVHRWTTGNPTTDELLRVWYVAVTRARRFATLAVPEEETKPLTNLLARHQVPTEIL